MTKLFSRDLFAVRLKSLMEDNNDTIYTLAEYLGLSPSAISKYTNAAMSPKMTAIDALSRKYGVNPIWLMGAENAEKIVLTEPETEEPYHYKSLNIPILGTIRAGKTIPVSDDYEGYLDLEEECQADFALRVVGDSMSWAGIHDGDTALVINSREPRHGDIVAAGKADGDWSATLKFYIANNGKPCLRAANPNYPDIPLYEGWTIVGVVTQIIKKAPGLIRYQELSTLKEDYDTSWNTVIETASEYGLDAPALNGFISAMHMMIKAAKK